MPRSDVGSKGASQPGQSKAALGAAPKPGRGRGVSRGLTKTVILDAAKVILADQSLSGFRIQDVSARLGVQPSAIYNHFENREDLLTALSDNIASQLIEFEEPGPEAPPKERLAFIVRHLTRIYYEDQLVARVQLHDTADRAMLNRGRARELNEYSRRRMIGILEEGARRGDFRAVDPVVIRTIVGGLCPSLVLWYVHDDQQMPDLETLQRAALELVFRYLDPHAAPIDGSL